MKILLVGEYSRLHNSLKEGLVKLGHEVLLAGNNDGFKNYPVDFHIGSKIAKNRWLFSFAKGFLKVTGINLVSAENAYRFNKMVAKTNGFDVVQLYNESAVKSSPKLEIASLKKLFAKYKNVYLLSCGIDYISIKYAYDKKFRYSILSPLFEDKTLSDDYYFILKILGKKHYRLHQFVFEHITGVIASDMDYHLPLVGNNKYLGMIPNPINTDIIPYIEPVIHGKIIIFHGVNTSNYTKKGNGFFDKALDIIREKYKDTVEIVRTENIPYAEYIKCYNSCHIFLDQVYAYDQGYNALEAMAKGKVVFTGAEKEWLKYYNIEEDTVAINALPDVGNLVEKLSMLIENPGKIKAISKNARAFIEREHHYVKIAGRYVEVWENHFKK